MTSGRGTAVTEVTGGWSGADLSGASDRWRVPVPAEVAAELVADARAQLRQGTPVRWHARRPAGLRRAEELAAEVRNRLASGLGFVVLTGFPASDLAETLVERAYWTLGLLLGRPVSQSRKGDLVGRVEDRGADISSPVQRGYESAAGLPFHVDRTDVIGLLCVRPAASGGISRLVCARAIHDRLARQSPELLAELYRPFPNDRRGEQRPGEPPWCGIPVFSRVNGGFATRYVRRFIEASQRHPDAPRLSAQQVRAMDAVDSLLETDGVALDMTLRPGDLQLVNNFRILHARTGFVDPAGGRGRLLLRLWLAFADSPDLPPHYQPLYGATAGGSYRGGVWPAAGPPDAIGRPVAELD